MQQIELVSGFSELKDLLIRTYQIEKQREKVRLYFSEEDNWLLMHDYNDHMKVVTLSQNIADREATQIEGQYAIKLVAHALNQLDPIQYLNHEFKLNGFFVF